MKALDIASVLVNEAESLNNEIHRAARNFNETNFLSDPANMPYAHAGYLLTLFGLVDTMAYCNSGGGSQNDKFVKFLETDVQKGGSAVHLVAVKMFRHSPAHTGLVRYLYDATHDVAYTWKLYFDELPPGVQHYTITPVDHYYQDDLLKKSRDISKVPKSCASINLSITAFAEAVRRGTNEYVEAMQVDPARRARAEARFPEKLMSVDSL